MPPPRFAALPTVLAGLAFAVPALPAAEATADRLAQLLKQYPAADTNRDGVFSLEEATAHARLLRQGKKASAADGEGAPAKERVRPSPRPRTPTSPTARTPATGSTSGWRPPAPRRRWSFSSTAAAS